MQESYRRTKDKIFEHQLGNINDAVNANLEVINAINHENIEFLTKDVINIVNGQIIKITLSA